MLMFLPPILFLLIFLCLLVYVGSLCLVSLVSWRLELVGTARACGKDTFGSWVFCGCFWSRTLHLGAPRLSVLYVHMWGFRPWDLTSWWVRDAVSDRSASAQEGSHGAGSRAVSRSKGPYHRGSLLRILRAAGALGSSAIGARRGRHLDALPLHKEVTRAYLVFLITAFCSFLFFWGLSVLGTLHSQLTRAQMWAVKVWLLPQGEKR